MVDVKLTDIMVEGYQDFAEAVMFDRAIPSIQDGFLPVYNKILYTMAVEKDFASSGKTKKCAKVIGATLSLAHPHGDVSLYNSLVNLIVSRNPLLIGQGNFACKELDSNSAAHRYTECKLSSIAEKFFINGVQKQITPFIPNYDNSKDIAQYLPVKIPNLLLNTTTGIAVGYSNHIPSHNPVALASAFIAFVNGKGEDELIKIIKHPDNSGVIMNPDVAETLYKTGKGTAHIRAEYEIVENKNGTSSIEFFNFPPYKSIPNTIEKVKELVKAQAIDGLSDIKDTSNSKSTDRRFAVRVDLKKGVSPIVILNKLFNMGIMKDTYSYRFLAINQESSEERVVQFTLMSYFEYFLNLRMSIIRNELIYDITKLADRLHVVDGLILIRPHIDEVISIIKKNSASEAKGKLIDKFKLTTRQVAAIVEMRLIQLSKTSLAELESEKTKLDTSIHALEKTLDSDKLIKKIIIADQEDFIKAIPKHQAEFKTKISYERVKADIDELIEDEDFIVTLSHDGVVKKVSPDSFNSQGRNGKGRKLANREGDFTTRIFNVSSRDTLLCFSNKGIVYKLQTYKIPETKIENVGSHIANYISFEKENERIVDIIKLSKADFSNENLFIFTGSAMAFGKLMSIEEFQFKHGTSLIAAKLSCEDDEIISATLVDGSKVLDDEESESENNVFAVMTSKDGFTLKCRISDISITKRPTIGSKMVKLKTETERIVSLDIIEERSAFVYIAKNGLCKMTQSNEFPIKRRRGAGVIGQKLHAKNNTIASFVLPSTQIGEFDILIATKANKVIRTPLSTVPETLRPTYGVKAIKLDENDYVVSATLLNKTLNEELE